MALSWFFYILIGTALWAISAVIIKFIRVKYIRHPLSYMAITAPIGLLVFFLLFFGRLKLPGIVPLILIFATSLAAFIGYWLYLTSLNKEDVSTIVTLFGVEPLMVLILATIFLGERLSLLDYLAFPLVISGSLLLSIQRTKKKLSCSVGIKVALISIVFYSINSLLLKMVAGVDFITVNVLRQVGWIFLALILLSSSGIRKNVREIFHKMDAKSLALTYIAEFMSFTGMIFAIFALKSGAVSLVTLVSSIQGFFVIILAALVSLFIPKMLKEKIDKKTLLLKICSACLIFAGIALIVL